MATKRQGMFVCMYVSNMYTYTISKFFLFILIFLYFFGFNLKGILFVFYYITKYYLTMLSPLFVNMNLNIQ